MDGPPGCDRVDMDGLCGMGHSYFVDGLRGNQMAKRELWWKAPPREELWCSPHTQSIRSTMDSGMTSRTTGLVIGSMGLETTGFETTGHETITFNLSDISSQYLYFSSNTHSVYGIFSRILSSTSYIEPFMG